MRGKGLYNNPFVNETVKPVIAVTGNSDALNMQIMRFSYQVLCRFLG